MYIMSTNSDPQTPTTVQRKERDGSSQTVSCPRSVVDYNQYMGGVDHADQLRNYYHVRTKSKKFYKYLFWFVFDCAVVNAFIIWKHYQPLAGVSMRQQSLKSFRLALAHRLIGSYNSHKRYSLLTAIREAWIDSLSTAKGARFESDPYTSDTDGHFPIKGTRGKCVFCWNVRRERHETNVHCRKCGKVLCVEARDASALLCLERYHLHTDYLSHLSFLPTYFIIPVQHSIIPLISHQHSVIPSHSFVEK